MNLLLLEAHQFITDSSATASPRQSEHIVTILRAQIGDTITLGKVNGNMGTGTITEILTNKVKLENIQFTSAPPPQLPITLILAMPRPQMLKRIIQTISTMGVKKLVLLQTSRVEKSFWQSPTAREDALHDFLLLGLEQGMATQLPTIEKHTRFRPFMEDHLAELAADSLRYIAHPASEHAPKAHTLTQNLTLAIGPEGGFIDKEVEKFKEYGFTALHLGQRILKVETAVPVLLAQLYQY